MVAIARGLMSSPRLLLLDEPSLGLAPKLVEEVFVKVQEIASRGVTVLVVEQNVVDGLSISNRGYVVENGAITLQGTPKELSQTLKSELPTWVYSSNILAYKKPPSQRRFCLRAQAY